MGLEKEIPGNINEKVLFIDVEITLKDSEEEHHHGDDDLEGHHASHSHVHDSHSHDSHSHHHSHNHHGLELDIPPLFPPLGISTIKRFINDRTGYYAKTFDAGIKITKDIHLNHSGERRLILTPEQAESMVNLEMISLDNLLVKSRRISLDSIQNDDNFDKRKLIYNLKILQDLIADAKVSDFGVIGFTVTTEVSLSYSLLMARMIKDQFPEKKVIFGGVFFNDLTRRIIEYTFVDFLVIGRGFISIQKILNIVNGVEDNLDSDGKILFKTSDGIGSIDASCCVSSKEFLELLPDYDDYCFEDYKVFGRELMLVLMFSSGCKYNCSYCSWNSAHNSVEYADIDVVVDNIIELKRKYGVEEFYITNSSINQDRDILVKFCTGLIEKNANIRYKALGNAEFIDKETATLLKDSGCEVLFLGIESFDDSVLKKAHKFHNREIALDALKTCNECGLFTIVCLISGLPGETEKEHEITKKVLSENASADDYAIFSFQLYSGSDIFRNPGKYGIKEILATRTAFNVPLKFGYAKDNETWEQISQKNQKHADDLKSVAYKKH